MLNAEVNSEFKLRGNAEDKAEVGKSQWLFKIANFSLIFEISQFKIHFSIHTSALSIVSTLKTGSRGSTIVQQYAPMKKSADIR
jgi:hypothetical protein